MRTKPFKLPSLEAVNCSNSTEKLEQSFNSTVSNLSDNGGNNSAPVLPPQPIGRTKPKPILSINANEIQIGKLKLQDSRANFVSGSQNNLNTSVTDSLGNLIEEEENKEVSISPVGDRLFLGNEDITRADDCVEQLTKMGVTHVINMAAEVKTPITPSSCPIMFSNFPMHDTPDEDILGILKEVSSYIDECLKETSVNKVFVHCKAGKSRSASALIAYYILKEKMSYKRAFTLVKRARPTIDPNIGFVMVLMSLDGSQSTIQNVQ